MKEDGERLKLSQEELQELSGKATAEERLLWAIFDGPTREEVEQVKSRIPEEVRNLIAESWADQDEQVLVDRLEEDLAKKLTPREAQVLRGRFGLEDGNIKTLKEIGRDIGRSATTARRVEQQAIRKLRTPEA